MTFFHRASLYLEHLRFLPRVRRPVRSAVVGPTAPVPLPSETSRRIKSVRRAPTSSHSCQPPAGHGQHHGSLADRRVYYSITHTKIEGMIGPDRIGLVFPR